jgi:[acyl-carrier-protein] S-malonyltransferase
LKTSGVRVSVNRNRTFAVRWPMERQKIGLIFPGQGSQYAGMGLEISNYYPVAREIFNRADDLLGYKISDLCWEKDEKHSREKMRNWMRVMGDRFHLEFLERLAERKRPLLEYTRYSQPAVFTVSVACFEAMRAELQNRGVRLDFDMAAGHSLGEYTALYSAGALDFENALLLVRSRGEFMQECGDDIEHAGLLSVVSKTKMFGIDQVCQRSNVQVSVYNNDFQIVLGGYEENLKTAKQIAEEMGFKGIPLKVSGPFHTYFMKPASDRMKRYLESIDLRVASRPIIANTSTRAIVDPVDIKSELVDQIFRPVLWKDSTEKLIRSGVRIFVEIGPGKVVSGLINRIDPTVKTLTIENRSTLETAVEELAKILSP